MACGALGVSEYAPERKTTSAGFTIKASSLVTGWEMGTALS